AALLVPAASSAAQTSDPRIALMERAAWDALSRGQAKTAADIFRQALSSDPNNAQLHVGAATAAYADRRDDDAKGELERALSLDRICALLNTYPTGAIPVVLYTTEQFSDITRAPSWAAGAYDGTIRVPMRGALDKEEELDRVLAHEFVHAIVHTLSKSAVPTWL